jgi:hypothetical protein
MISKRELNFKRRNQMSRNKIKKAQRRRKKLKRTFRVDVTELECVIEYTFYDEPHILLAQVTSFLIRTTDMLFF